MVASGHGQPRARAVTGNVGRLGHYSTSTAYRPLYQPQLGQTTWGSLAESQLGHTLRAGASSRQADARRLRVFDFDVFFLGTAMRSCARSGNGAS